MPEPPAPPPQFPPVHPALLSHTGVLVSRVGMAAQKRFSGRLECLGLTPRTWGALNVLAAEGPISQHALCKCVASDPSSMVSTLDELEARGLVERRRDPSDRRAHALYVTTSGRQALTRGRELALRAQEDLLGPLNDEEREQLHQLLLKLTVGPE